MGVDGSDIHVKVRLATLYGKHEPILKEFPKETPYEKSLLSANVKDEVLKLILIVQDGPTAQFWYPFSKPYLLEKLWRIYRGTPITLHPRLQLRFNEIDWDWRVTSIEAAKSKQEGQVENKESDQMERLNERKGEADPGATRAASGRSPLEQDARVRDQEWRVAPD